MKHDVLAFTTIRQGSPASKVESLRAQIALDTMRQLQLHGMPCVVVYTDCDATYLQQLEKLGAQLVLQEKSGMGNARRQALQSAYSRTQDETYLLWLEPEKPDLPRFAPNMYEHMLANKSPLGLFNRSQVSMNSYPSEQAHYYLFCRAVASALVGADIDYAFGPMMLRREAASRFLSYTGKYGDLWAAILVPRIPLIKRCLFSVIEVDFQNDPRMTLIESGDTEIIMKRLQQFNNVIPALIAEWQER